MNERGGDRRAAGGPPKPPGRSSPKANGLNELGHLGPGPGAGRGRDEERKVANEAGLAALAEEMHRPPGGRSGRRRKAASTRRRRRVKRGVLIGVAVLLVLVGGGAGYAYYLTHELKRIEVKGLHGALDTGAEAGTENILMVGSTSRCALTRAEPGLRVVLAGRERREQRRDHDPPRRPGPPPAGAPLHPPRPVHPQRPEHRGQQDRRRPLRGSDPAGGGHRGGLRDPHPARRLAQLRPVRQRGGRPRRHQHVLPDVGLRRLVRA